MKLDTLCVQGAYKPKNGEPRVIPIVQSTTYKYDTSEEMGDLFDLKATGYFYSRLQNPTCDYAAAKIALLEGGVAGMLTSSGQAANLCFCHLDRRRIFMLFSILRRQAIMLFQVRLFTAEPLIFSMLR